MGKFDVYYHNGYYTVDYRKMPEQRKNIMANELSDEFYYTEGIKKIYMRLFPDADEEELNPHTEGTRVQGIFRILHHMIGTETG